MRIAGLALMIVCSGALMIGNAAAQTIRDPHNTFNGFLGRLLLTVPCVLLVAYVWAALNQMAR